MKNLGYLSEHTTSHLSQNHRMVEVGGDLWRSFGPTPLLKQGHQEPLAQNHVQMTFAYVQGWRLHNLPEQPVPVLGHPHNEKVFPDVQREPPVVQCPVTSGGLMFSQRDLQEVRVVSLSCISSLNQTALSRFIPDGP